MGVRSQKLEHMVIYESDIWQSHKSRKTKQMIDIATNLELRSRTNSQTDRKKV